MALPLRIEFGVRGGVEKAVRVQRILGTGPVITGRWLTKPRILTGDRMTKRLLQAFANARTGVSPEKYSLSVAQFTADWGPLTAEFAPGGSFQERVMQWCTEQSKFRSMLETFGRMSALRHWPKESTKESARQPDDVENVMTKSEIPDTGDDLLTNPANRALGIPEVGFEREEDEKSRYYTSVPLFDSTATDLDSSATDIYRHAGNTPPAANLETVNNELEVLRKNWGDFFPEGAYPHFAVDSGPFEDFGRTPGARGTLRVGARTLLRFLTLSLFAMDGRYLRKCWRPDCTQPYFIADDLKVHYCSHRCSQWSRTEWKNRWWREHGKEWRKAKAKDKTPLHRRTR